MIDAHIHYGDDSPEFLALLAEFDLKLLNISFVHGPDDPWRNQAECYRSLARAHPTRFAWCTSIDLPRFDDPTYTASAIRGLEEDFAAGAVACKVWKNIGMEERRPDGSYLTIDDPIFDPIFDAVAAAGRTLLLHIAEPLACWQPLDPSGPHYSYYSQNPQWHMYNRPEVPSHAALIAARDRVMEKHPALRVVGAHLGSLEHDVDEVAARLDRYPNFAVDISARLGNLARQPADKVRAFFDRYQDRILFGTDVVMRTAPAALPPEERAAALAPLAETYRTHFAYLEGTTEVTVRGYTTTGLGLSPSVLDKLYTANAQAWYPGI